MKNFNGKAEKRQKLKIWWIFLTGCHTGTDFCSWLVSELRFSLDSELRFRLVSEIRCLFEYVWTKWMEHIANQMKCPVTLFKYPQINQKISRNKPALRAKWVFWWNWSYDSQQNKHFRAWLILIGYFIWENSTHGVELLALSIPLKKPCFRAEPIKIQLTQSKRRNDNSNQCNQVWFSLAQHFNTKDTSESSYQSSGTHNDLKISFIKSIQIQHFTFWICWKRENNIPLRHLDW